MPLQLLLGPYTSVSPGNPGSRPTSDQPRPERFTVVRRQQTQSPFTRPGSCLSKRAWYNNTPERDPSHRQGIGPGSLVLPTPIETPIMVSSDVTLTLDDPRQ